MHILRDSTAGHRTAGHRTAGHRTPVYSYNTYTHFMSLLKQLCCSTSPNCCIDVGLKISVLVICCDPVMGINVARSCKVHQSTSLITGLLYLERHSDTVTYQ